jgi:hypothetical protein
MSALLRADQPTWTLDVTGLVVADHAGLRAIGSCYRRAVRHGRRLALHGASPALRHALYRLRLDQHLMSSSRVAAGGSGSVAGVRLPLVPEPAPPSSPTGEATGIDSLHRGFPAPGTT